MNKKYSLGLSSYPLLNMEIETAAKIYMECKDWPETKTNLMDENLIQRNRMSTRNVASNETIKRLKKAYEWEVDYLATSDDSKDKRFICLLITTRQYILLLDFITEFLIYKKDGLDFMVTNQEIKNWFDIQGETHEEIARMKPGTYKRLMSNTRLILAGGGLLVEEGENYQITLPGISATLQNKYMEYGRIQDLRCFLMNDREIQEMGK